MLLPTTRYHKWTPSTGICWFLVYEASLQRQASHICQFHFYSLKTFETMQHGITVNRDSRCNLEHHMWILVLVCSLISHFHPCRLCVGLSESKTHHYLSELMLYRQIDRNILICGRQNEVIVFYAIYYVPSIDSEGQWPNCSKKLD